MDFIKIRRSIILASLILAFSSAAVAQAPPTPPPPEREGSAEFAFVGTSGNSSTQTIGVAGELILRPMPWETRVKTAYVRNESDDELKAQVFLLTARAQRRLRPRLSGYGQYAYERDRFAGIVNRNVAEGGLSFLWVDQPSQKFVVDGSAGYANEERLVGENISTAVSDAGVLYTLKISGTSEISEDGHSVFSLSDSHDWRYTNIVALTAKVSTIFSLKLSNTVRYVNLPVTGFKGTDVVTSVALVAKF